MDGSSQLLRSVISEYRIASACSTQVAERRSIERRRRLPSEVRKNRR